MEFEKLGFFFFFSFPDDAKSLIEPTNWAVQRECGVAEWIV